MIISLYFVQHKKIGLYRLTSIPGNGVTSEPTAKRMFLVLRTSDEPSSFLTLTWPGALTVPKPRIPVTLTRTNHSFFCN